VNIGQPVVQRRDVIIVGDVIDDVIRDVTELVPACGLGVVAASFDVAAMSVWVVVDGVAVELSTSLQTSRWCPAGRPPTNYSLGGSWLMALPDLANASVTQASRLTR